MSHLTVASFAGSGQNSIQALATDSANNVFVAGTTSSPDLPVKNAAQPAFGESRILRSTDLGVTWTRVAAPLDVSFVVPDPVDAQVLFGGGSAGIYRSADGGLSWSLVYPSRASGLTFGTIAVDPGNHLRIAAVSGNTAAPLVRSFDGGTTWSASLPCAGSYCIGPLLADPAGSGALVTRGLVAYLSRDWGATFQPLQPPGRSMAAVAFDPSHPGWIYAGTSRGVLGALYLSTDFGATWTVKASPPTSFSAINTLAVDPDFPSTLVASTADGFYVSSDGAASWTRQAGAGTSIQPNRSVPFALVSHHCSPTGGLVASVSGSGSYQVDFSPDLGVTWNVPQLTEVTGVAAGPGCAVYAFRQTTTDVFVAKLSADGTPLWTTFLGGADQDTPIGLAVDGQGSVYVAGNTTSPDFPATVPRIGVRGRSAIFVAKFAPDGSLAYSAVVNGEALDTASALAVDADRNVYVGGHTDSHQFPITPGALIFAFDTGAYTGFLLKLGPDASLVYGTYLGSAYTFPGAILVDPAGQPIVAGTGPVPGFTPPAQNSGSEFVMRLDRAGSRVLSVHYIDGASVVVSGPSALAWDASGNLIVSGSTGGSEMAATPGAYDAPAAGSCTQSGLNPAEGHIYVVKLAAADWSPMYTAMLRAPCAIMPGPIAVERDGAVVLGLATGPRFPLRRPLFGAPACSRAATLVARLSGDGSRLEFATYLDQCGVPGIALGSDGSMYAGASSGRFGGPAEVQRLPPQAQIPLSLDGIANAFSGDASAVIRGGLFSITASGLAAPAVDLGLNPGLALPTELAGVEVRFDGVPAPLVQTGPGRAIVVAPFASPRQQAGLTRGFTAVQLFFNGTASNAVWMPVKAALPGLLTGEFLSPMPHTFVTDGYVVNQDGTVNDANHPAAFGSTITLFVTGMGATNPPTAAGSIAGAVAIVPVAPLYTTFDTFNPYGAPPPTPVSSLPGFVSAVFQVRVATPKTYNNGVVLENGVLHANFALKLDPPVPESSVPPSSNYVGIYLK